MLFDAYGEQLVLDTLKKTWRRIIGQVMFVSSRATRVFSLGSWSREAILSWGIDFILRMVTNVQEDTMITIPEFRNYFQREAEYRALLGRIVPYIDPNYGDISEIKNDLLQAIKGYDVLTLASVWRVLIAHGVARFNSTLPLIDELFHAALLTVISHNRCEYISPNHCENPSSRGF